LHSLWLGILVVLCWSRWLHEFISFLLGELLLDSWELIRGHSILLVNLDVRFGLNVLGVFMTEGVGSISLLTPIIKVELVVSDLGVSASWGLSFLSSISIALGFTRLLILILVGFRGLGVCNDGTVSFQAVVGRSVRSLLTPISQFVSILKCLRFGSSWALRGLLHIDLRFSLEQVAVVEFAFDKVEEVSNELSLLGLVELSEDIRVNFLLEKFVHINLQVGFEESFFSQANLVQVA